MHLQQKLSIFGGKLHISLDQKDVLSVRHKKWLNINETKYLIDHINPQYETFKRFSIASAIVSLTSLVLAIVLGWYGKTYYQPPDDGPILFFSILAAITFVITAIKAYNSRINIILFNGHDGQRLFSLLANQPSTQEAIAFCDTLAQRIDRIRYNGDISSGRMKEILYQHVDFLLSQEVLTEQEAETAIDRIAHRSRPHVLKFSKDDI